MRRIRVATGVVLAAATIAMTGGHTWAAESRPVGVLQWRGHLAHGIVTTCDPVAQTDCTAWVAIASRESLNFLGTREARSGLFVFVYDVTWEDGEPHPSDTPVAEGWLPGADVDIPHTMAWATSHGTIDLDHCADVDGEWVCTPTGESVTLDLRWTATGKANRYRDAFTESDDGGRYSIRNWGAARPADLVATVDGAAVATIVPPFGEGPAIDNDATVEVCLRCGLEPPL